MMVARSGTVATARGRTCGQDRHIEGVESNTHFVGVARQKQASCFEQGGRSGCASSSSGDGEDKVLAYKACWANETELRELREEIKRLKKVRNRRCRSKKQVKSCW